MQRLIDGVRFLYDNYGVNALLIIVVVIVLLATASFVFGVDVTQVVAEWFTPQ